MVRKALIFILIVSGLLFLLSVMLMSPKGGLGVGIAGSAGGGGEYGSKKSVEGTLKKVAVVSSIMFIITAFILPYTA